MDATTTHAAVSPLVIELHPHEDKCCICGMLTASRQGIAMYEDEILPDDHPGPWAGFTACLRCYLLVRGLHATFPRVSFPVHHVRQLIGA